MADVSIPVIRIARLNAVAITYIPDTIQCIIAILHIQSSSIMDAAPPPYNVVLITGTYPRRVSDFLYLPDPVVGIGDQAASGGALLLQIATCIIHILIGMPVAHRTDYPAYAVVIPCADAGVLPFRVHGLFIYRSAEDVASALQPPPVPIHMQGKIPFLIILERLLIAQLVDALPDLPKTVVACALNW